MRIYSWQELNLWRYLTFRSFSDDSDTDDNQFKSLLPVFPIIFIETKMFQSSALHRITLIELTRMRGFWSDFQYHNPRFWFLDQNYFEKVQTIENILLLRYSDYFDLWWGGTLDEQPFLLATLVALHLTPVSESVSQWAEFQTSVASRLASLLRRQVIFGPEKLGSVHFNARKCNVLLILI